MQRILALLALACSITATAADSGKRPFTAADVNAIKSVADPQLSPDGEWVAYTVRTNDLEKDKRTTLVWITSWDGKRSLQLDLTSDEGKRVLADLIARADVLIEDADLTQELVLPELAPRSDGGRLVHLRISGFGPVGPWADLPGSEIGAQLAAEVTSALGHFGEEAAVGPIRRVSMSSTSSPSSLWRRAEMRCPGSSSGRFTSVI